MYEFVPNRMMELRPSPNSHHHDDGDSETTEIDAEGAAISSPCSRDDLTSMAATAISRTDAKEEKTRYSVQFQNIELIEIGVVLGDNPSLSTGGPPMSLGWELLGRSTYALDYYEDFRPPRKDSRRKLIVSKKARTKFFLRCGYPLSEIEEAAAISLNYRNQMTVSKLLDPSLPQTVEDAVKDRFASSHKSESGRSRLRRRHSNDSRIASHERTSRIVSNDITPSHMYRRLSNEPSGSLRHRMAVPRRSSVGFAPPPSANSSRAARRYSNEPVAMPIRQLSPGPGIGKRRQRRNSPTGGSALSHSALLCPPPFATSTNKKENLEHVSDEAKQFTRRRRQSRDGPRRGRRAQFIEVEKTTLLGCNEGNETGQGDQDSHRNFNDQHPRRHHLAPVQPLRLPTRTVSPEQVTESLVLLPETLADMPSSLPISETVDLCDTINTDNETSHSDIALMPCRSIDSTEKHQMKSSEHTATTAASSLRISDESISSIASFSSFSTSFSSYASGVVLSTPNSPNRDEER